MSVVILSTGYYPDPDIGKPIANGYIYVGTVDLDPEVPANQKTISVLQEDGTEVAVAQPLRTSAGGVPTYNGSPVTINAASPYSLLVKDSDDVQKIYSPSNTGSSQANDDWSEEGAAVAFDSASTFTVAGDVTADYPAHRAVRLTQTTDDTGFVVSSVFGAVTTVTVRAATVDSGLTKVEYGQEVASSPGGSSEDFHADIVGDLEGNVVGELVTITGDLGSGLGLITGTNSNGASGGSGVKGVSSGDIGVGVSGSNTSATGATSAIGVYGTTTNAGGYGVFSQGNAKVVGSLEVTLTLTVGNRLNIPTFTPSAASSTGTEGDITWDADYVYVCISTNTWKRVAIATW